MLLKLNKYQCFLEIKLILTSIKFCSNNDIRINLFTNMEQIFLGRINKVYKYYDNKLNTDIILKTNENEENILSEYNSQIMLENKGFNIPKIYFKDNNTIRMKFIEADIIDKSMIKTITKFELMKLHQIKHNNFGNIFDTFSANDKVCNNYNSCWVTFFKNQRWLPLFENHTNEKVKELALKISDIMYKIFENCNITPSLLHGDANPNNFIIHNDKVYFIDSACFYGDPNYDIASYDFWNGDLSDQPYAKLYYSYILCVTAKLTLNENRNKQAIKYMKEILSLYHVLYPSLIIGLNKLKKEIKYTYVIFYIGNFDSIDINHINNINTSSNYVQQKHDCDNNDILIVVILNNFNKSAKINLNDRIKICEVSLKNINYNCLIDWSCIELSQLINHWKNLLGYDFLNYINCGTNYISTLIKEFETNQNFICNKVNKFKFPKNLKKYNVDLIEGSNIILD